MMARDAALKKITNSKSRRLLAQNQSEECTDVRVSDLVSFCKLGSRKSAPRWRGPSVGLDIEEVGVTAEVQEQTFQVA